MASQAPGYFQGRSRLGDMVWFCRIARGPTRAVGLLGIGLNVGTGGARMEDEGSLRASWDLQETRVSNSKQGWPSVVR